MTPKQNSTNQLRSVKAWLMSPGSIGTRTGKGPLSVADYSVVKTLVKQSRCASEQALHNSVLYLLSLREEGPPKSRV